MSERNANASSKPQSHAKLCFDSDGKGKGCCLFCLFQKIHQRDRALWRHSDHLVRQLQVSPALTLNLNAWPSPRQPAAWQALSEVCLNGWMQHGVEWNRSAMSMSVDWRDGKQSISSLNSHELVCHVGFQNAQHGVYWQAGWATHWETTVLFGSVVNIRSVGRITPQK